MNQVISEGEAARMLSISVQTLRNWRCMFRGPKYLKLGRSVRYSMLDLERWMNEHTINPKEVYTEMGFSPNYPGESGKSIEK